MTAFMHVGFAFAGVPKMRDLEPVMTSLGEDWIRYAATSWILWRPREMMVMYSTLVRYIDSNDGFIIAPIDLSQCTGHMPAWVWTWMSLKGVGVATGAPIDQAVSNYMLAIPRP